MEMNEYYKPKTVKELRKIVKYLIQKRGNLCSLNDIDVGEITNMTCLFMENPEFNGDISEWNVRNVTEMSYLFGGSSFNQDLSMWDIRGVKNMRGMFFCCHYFNQDMSRWNVRDKQCDIMFYDCPITMDHLPKYLNLYDDDERDNE